MSGFAEVCLIVVSAAAYEGTRHGWLDPALARFARFGVTRVLPGSATPIIKDIERGFWPDAHRSATVVGRPA